MAYTKATMRAVDKYVRNNYDSFLVRVPKGRKQVIEARAKQLGQSVNSLINALLMGDIGLTENEWRRSDESIINEE